MGLANLRCGATPPSEKVHCVPILFWVGLRSIPKDGGHRSTHTSERWLQPSAHISLSSALYPAHTSLSSSFLGGRPPPFQAPNPIPPLQRSTTHRHHGSSPIQQDSTWILKDRFWTRIWIWSLLSYSFAPQTQDDTQMSGQCIALQCNGRRTSR